MSCNILAIVKFCCARTTQLFWYFHVATVIELMEETKEVIDVEMLALYLEIKTEVVQRIQAECPLDIKRAKLRLFTFWVENDINASWSKLTAALQSLDKRVLAKTICDKITGEYITFIYLCRL